MTSSTVGKERFLSIRRTSLPDIDIDSDVESARRLEVYDKIIDRFGAERVAVSGMPETYRARHALRDTGLALGIAPYEPTRAASLMGGRARRPESSSGLGSRFVAVGEMAVGEPPEVLVRSQLPGLVGSDRLRDPLVELREGMGP